MSLYEMRCNDSATAKAWRESGLVRIDSLRAGDIFEDIDGNFRRVVRQETNGVVHADNIDGNGCDLYCASANVRPTTYGNQRRIQGTQAMEMVEGKVLLPPANSVLCNDSDPFAVYVQDSDGLRLVSTHASAAEADEAAAECNRNDTARQYDWAHATTTIEHYHRG